MRQLSRFVDAREAAATKAGAGRWHGVDIVIGTHALLAESIKFKRLGLVIVDEEQHFWRRRTKGAAQGAQGVDACMY